MYPCTNTIYNRSQTISSSNTEEVPMDIDSSSDSQKPLTTENTKNTKNVENATENTLSIMDDPKNFIDFEEESKIDSTESNFNPFNTYIFNESFIKHNGKDPSNTSNTTNFDLIPDVEYILLTNEELVQTKHLLWGSKGSEHDICRWYSQGFGFVEDSDHNNDIRFGLLQLHGGPCGILAPVQAYMLREMLFNKSLNVKLDDGSKKTPILPTNEQRETALINALVHIMVKCSIDPTYLQWIVSADIEHDKFWKVICHSREELLNVIRYHTLPLIYSKIGVVCFVFSILLSRTLDVVMDDVDDSTQPLILPQHGHCSQDIVNLMITGYAHTNIHDNDKYLGDPKDESCFILKGIGAGQEIGFLTTLEPMRLAKVGDHFKCPKYPIWIIGSTSHYTVLFSLDINVSNVSKSDQKRQELKRAFHKFDPDEIGILKWSVFPKLLKELKCDINAYSIKSLVDPDNTGHILWYSFERAWGMIENQARLAWQCTRCTLYNKVNDDNCSVCGGTRGNSAFVQRPKDHTSNADANAAKEDNSKRAPMQFVMYLYNGLKATKKDRPTVTKLMVYDDADIHAFPSHVAEELTGLIRTKWPLAVVEYDGPFVPHMH